METPNYAAAGPLRTLIDSVEGLQRELSQCSSNESRFTGEAIKRLTDVLRQWGSFRDAEFRREARVLAHHFAMLAAGLASLEGLATRGGQDGVITESHKRTTIDSLGRVLAQLHSMLEALKTTLW